MIRTPLRYVPSVFNYLLLFCRCLFLQDIFFLHPHIADLNDRRHEERQSEKTGKQLQSGRIATGVFLHHR